MDVDVELFAYSKSIYSTGTITRLDAGTVYL